MTWQVVAEVSAAGHRRYVLGLDAVTTAKLRWVFTGMTTRRRDAGLRRAAAVGRDRPPRRGGRPPLPDVSPGLALVLQRGSAQAARPGDRRQPGRADRQSGSHPPTREPYVLDGYLHDGNDGKGEKSIRFVPEVPRAGSYEIRLSYVPYQNRSSNTPVTITTPAGSKTVRINQQQAPEIDRLFHSLGTFELPAGRQTSIVVETAGTDGYVVVDALQLIDR